MSAPDTDGEEGERPTGATVPARLPTAVAPDPFNVAPGAILLSRRFCVIGPVRHRSASWQVPATDLKRRFGLPPHHRVELVFLSTDVATRDRVFAMLDALSVPEAPRRGAPPVVRVHAVLATDDGLAIVTHPLEPLRDPSDDEHRQVAYDLARMLARLHEAGSCRVRWSSHDWRVDSQGHAQFADWSWLLAVEPTERPEVLQDDVEALQALFRGAEWPPEASRPVSSAAELLAGLAPPLPEAGTPLLLTDEMPFVGRAAAFEAIQRAVDAARESGPAHLTVVGPSGAGASKVLVRAGERLGAHSLVVRCTKPHLDGLFTALADSFDGLESARRREIVARIVRQVGDGARELCAFDRRFEPWFGSPPPRARVVREYPRRMSRLVALLAAIGSPGHPLVLLLDRFDEGSGAVQSLVQRLLAEGESHCTAIVEVRGLCTPRVPARSIELAPLTVAEVEEWLRGGLPGSVPDAPAMAAWLCEQVEPWPAELVAELQRAIVQGRIERRVGWRLASSAPVTLTSVAELDDDTQWLALLLAVEGGRGGVLALRQLARWPVDRLREQLTELRKLGLVRSGGGTLAFTTEGVRQAALAAATPERRRHAHRAMARHLARRPEVSTSALVYHEDQGQLEGDDGALAQRHLRAAEEQLHFLNFERAHWHYARAAERGAEAQVQRRAQRGRADALLLLGAATEALAAYRVALDHAGGPEDVIAIAERAGNALVVRHPRATLALVDDALRRLGRPVPRGALAAAWQAVRTWLGLGTRLGPAAMRALGALSRSLVELAPVVEPMRLPTLWLRGFEVARRTGDARGLRQSRIQLARGPLGRFAPEWAQSTLSVAVEDARRDDDPFCEGLAWLGRAERWWPTGRSGDVLHALERATACFELAESPIWSARAQSALVVHQLLCEPIRTLEARIEALRRTARRQVEQDFGPLIEALTIWTRVRSGRSAGDPATSSARSAGAETAVGVWADAIAALAWIEADEVVLAQRFAERASSARRRLPAGSRSLDLALVAVAWVGVRRGAPFVDETRRRVRRLRRRARHNPGLEPFAWLVEAHQSVVDDDLGRARHAVDRALQTAALQRQRWIALDAHALLSRLWAAGDPQQAEHQRVRTEALRGELVEIPPRAASPLAAPSPDPPVAPTRLDTLVHGLLDTLKHHLDGREVETRLSAGIRVTVRREPLELLFVSMMLLVHEVAEGSLVRLTTETRPDERVALRIVAGPAMGEPNPLAVAECDEVARQIGASFTMEPRPDRLVVEARLPVDDTAPVHHGLVAICVEDARIERMLVEQLRSLGWDAMVAHLDERLDSDVLGGFVGQGRTLDLPAGAWTISVVPRRDGWRQRSELPIPFEIDELRGLLDDQRSADAKRDRE